MEARTAFTSIWIIVSFIPGLLSRSSFSSWSCWESLCSCTDSFSRTVYMLPFKEVSCPFIPERMSNNLSFDISIYTTSKYYLLSSPSNSFFNCSLSFGDHSLLSSSFVGDHTFSVSSMNASFVIFFNSEMSMAMPMSLIFFAMSR